MDIPFKILNSHITVESIIDEIDPFIRTHFIIVIEAINGNYLILFKVNLT